MILDSKGKSTDPSYLGQGGKRPSSTNLDDIEMRRFVEFKKLMSEDYSSGLVKATKDLWMNFRQTYEILHKISGEYAERLAMVMGKIGQAKDIESMKQSQIVALLREYDKIMEEILKKKSKMGELSINEEEALKKQKELRERTSRESRELGEDAGKRGGGVADVLRTAGQVEGLGALGQIGNILAGGFTLQTLMSAVVTLIKAYDDMVKDSREFRRALATPGAGAGAMSVMDVQRILTATEKTAKEFAPDITKDAINQFLDAYRSAGASNILPSIFGVPIKQAMAVYEETKGERMKEYEDAATSLAEQRRDVLMGGETDPDRIKKINEDVTKFYEKTKDDLIRNDEDLKKYTAAFGTSLGKLIGTMSAMQNILGMDASKQTQFLMDMDRMFDMRLQQEEGMAISTQKVREQLPKLFDVSANEIEQHKKDIEALKSHEDSIQAGRIAMTQFALTADRVQVPINTYMEWINKSSDALRWFGFSAFQSNDFLSKFGRQIYEGKFALEDLIGGFEQLYGVINPDKFALFGELIGRNVGMLDEDVRKKVQGIGGTSMGAMMQQLIPLMEIVREGERLYGKGKGEQALPDISRDFWEMSKKQFDGNLELMKKTITQIQERIMSHLPARMMDALGGRPQNAAEMAVIQSWLQKEFSEWMPGKDVKTNVYGGKAFENFLEGTSSELKSNAVSLSEATKVYIDAMSKASKEFSTIGEGITKSILGLKEYTISGDVKMANVQITNAIISQSNFSPFIH